MGKVVINTIITLLCDICCIFTNNNTSDGITYDTSDTYDVFYINNRSYGITYDTSYTYDTSNVSDTYDN